VCGGGGTAGGLGGVCNNVGCIPTKAMLESAKYAKKAGSLKEFRRGCRRGQAGHRGRGKRAGTVASQGAKGVGFLFKKNKVEHVEGWAGWRATARSRSRARMASARSREAHHHRDGLAAARPADPEVRRRARLEQRPGGVPEGAAGVIGIIGAGAIGMEFADVYNAFGSKVTVIEALEQVLPLEDAECAAVVEKSYRKRGIDMHVARGWRRRTSARTA
jgi:dihydrolipoamide dehydrogenase